MPIVSRFEAHPGYLLVTNTGTDDSLPEALAYVDSLVAEAEKHDRVRFLIDDRAAIHVLHTADTLAVAEHLLERFGAKHVEKVVVVGAPESQATREEFAVFMRARGMGFKRCESLAEAKEWLMHDEDLTDFHRR
jgi:hypothetical protein